MHELLLEEKPIDQHNPLKQSPQEKEELKEFEADVVRLGLRKWPSFVLSFVIMMAVVWRLPAWALMFFVPTLLAVLYWLYKMLYVRNSEPNWWCLSEDD